MEYNYICAGYKSQVIEEGGDLKKGYHLIEFGDWKLPNMPNRDVKFTGLVRDGDTKPCAIMVNYKNTATAADEYLCIPSANAPQELWDKALALVKEEFYDNPDAMLCYSWGMMKFSSDQLVQK